MEQSWLQKQAALNKFDGFRECEPRSCVKPTAVPAASLHFTANNILEASGVTDTVFDPQDAAADWSGFAPKHAPGRRRMHEEPAAHKETGDNVLIGGPSALEPGERFVTCARAANSGEPTPVELKSEEWRYRRTVGKKHVTPAYDYCGRSRPERCQVDRLRGSRLGRVGASHGAGDAQDVTQNILGSRARAANGPGSLLNGLGREVVESRDLFRNKDRTRRGDVQQAGASNDTGTTYVGFRNKELFATNYNPFVAGYAGHQPRRR